MFLKNRKQLHEAKSIMQQLQRIITKQYNIKLNLRILNEVPTRKQTILLRQIIMSGYLDQVARLWNKNQNKFNPSSKVEPTDVSTQSYECLTCLDPVFIHKKSCLILLRSQPSWVVYQQLTKNNKIYMKGCTQIEAHWLFNLGKEVCTISRPLSIPSPRYEIYTDRIICFVEVRFSAAGWLLPIQKIEIIDALDNSKYFAKFFLEGLIFTDFKQFSPYLILKLDLLTTYKSKQKEVQLLIEELKQRSCSSKKN